VKQRILFLCTGNSARSQMAEALLPLIAGDHFEAVSAGTHPAGLNPMTIEVMQEVGVDIRHHRSKSVEKFLSQEFDYVITVCDRAKETCPVFSGARNIRHWSFDDPAAAAPQNRREVFQRVRDEIAERLCEFLNDVGVPPTAVGCIPQNLTEKRNHK